MQNCRIISESDQPFKDRREAGRLLARELEPLRGSDIVVLGIPAGGIMVAKELAANLNAELDIVLSRKMGSPSNPELAIGALSEDGKGFLNEEIVSELGISQEFIEEEKKQQAAEISRRVKIFRGLRKKAELKNRIVIITDDGAATGATMQAALWLARKEGPSKLIAALPVGSRDAVNRLCRNADELICLRLPAYFGAVGQFYSGFAQIDDKEVSAILKEAQSSSEKQ